MSLEAFIILPLGVISLAAVVCMVLIMPTAPASGISADITLLDGTFRFSQIPDAKTPVGNSSALRGRNGAILDISPTLQPLFLFVTLRTSVDGTPGDLGFLLGYQIQEYTDAMLPFRSLTLCRGTTSAVSGMCVSGLRDDLESSLRRLFRQWICLYLYDWYLYGSLRERAAIQVD